MKLLEVIESNHPIITCIGGWCKSFEPYGVTDIDGMLIQIVSFAFQVPDNLTFPKALERE
jgi:hypothetical protein